MKGSQGKLPLEAFLKGTDQRTVANDVGSHTLLLQLLKQLHGLLPPRSAFAAADNGRKTHHIHQQRRSSEIRKDLKGVMPMTGLAPGRHQNAMSCQVGL